MNAVKRSILRWIHLIVCIPILGYVYGPISEVQQYAPAVRLVFVPVILLSGFWMYMGMVFAILGVAIWLGAYELSGYGAAVMGVILLLIVRKIWLVVRSWRTATKRAETAR